MPIKYVATSLVFAGAGLVSFAAPAEQELYSDSEGTTGHVFSIDLIGAVYSSQNSWFGESASFIGENTDSWADFGAEPKVSLEMAMGEGVFFGQVSGVYTSTYGTDASGVGAGLDDTSELTLEQGHIGWRAEDFFEGIGRRDGDVRRNLYERGFEPPGSRRSRRLLRLNRVANNERLRDQRRVRRRE
jgi:hypothetical protein